MSADEIHVAINSNQDIVVARQHGRALAVQLGFSAVDATFLATAISELARNIVSYARKGQITIKAIRDSARNGIMVIASDRGPGISDIQQALRDGFSTSGSLGMGLPGVRRLMDEFAIVSHPDRGTVVTIKKWKQ